VKDLLDLVVTLVSLVSPEKVQAIASRIRSKDQNMAARALANVVGTPLASSMVDQLIDAWRATDVSVDELALMLLAASHALTHSASQQSVELVWTGPTTPFVSTRRTEQALLQVINVANHQLFMTSFVAHDVSMIVKALNAASTRGVSISMLLELSKDHGGNITFDVIGNMRSSVPDANLFAWKEKADPFTAGSVHAKVAVADRSMCFVTSANLTGHAMDKNMEAGVLITGGAIPELLENHLQSLIDTKVIVRV